MNRPLFVLLLTLGFAPAAALAQTGPGATVTPQIQPTIEVSRAAGPIEIDGELDDAGWQDAARATGFVEHFPNEMAAPEYQSEAWVAYDDEYLYLAFVAHDDPATIRTSVRDRDQNFSDDFIGLMLDTYGDASWAYELFVNPSGVQGDLRMVGTGGEDSGFDIVWYAESKITDTGYQVEMAIPFKSLRFPSRAEQVWRVNFWRTRPRESRAQHSWAAIDRDNQCFMCQWGTMTGIRGVEPGGALELLPSLVASHSTVLEDPDDPDSGLDDSEFDADAGLTARYAHPSGITLEGAINPDFSQVESDVAQIDVNSTFALFFDERRPFFQEGSELFESYFSLVYTRQINDPVVAAKAVGRLGRTSFAYIGAYDKTSPVLLPFQQRSFVGTADESFSNIARVRRTYGQSSYVGATLTDRRFEEGGGAGTAWGLDGSHRFMDNYRFEYQAVGSHTQEPDEAGPTATLEDFTFDDGEHTGVFDGESFSGWGGYASLERSARFWSFDFDYWVSSPTFRADDGFETRNDLRNFAAFQEVNWYPDRSWIDRFGADIRGSWTWTYEGEKRERVISPSIEAQLPLQTFFELGGLWFEERFMGVDFDDMTELFVFVESTPIEEVSGGVYMEFGDGIARNLETPLKGDASFLEVFATLKPIDRLVIQPSVQWSRLEAGGEEIFDGYIFRTRTTFNLTRRLFGRVIVQYDEFDEALSVEPLVTYRINPYTLFYVGSTNAFSRFDRRDQGLGNDFDPTSRQFFAKIQYLFQP